MDSISILNSDQYQIYIIIIIVSWSVWRSLALSVPIYRNFQSNGALNKKNYKYTLLYKNISKFENSPFSSIWLKISINWHTKRQGPKKNEPVLQRGGSSPAPSTPLVIRVFLLLKSCLFNPLILQLYIMKSRLKHQ